MKYYMSLDGGGTKLAGLLFDEDANIVASALSKGINDTVYTESARRENIRDCYRQLFENTEKEIELEHLWIVYGNEQMYLGCLPEGVRVKDCTYLGEGVAGLAAGMGLKNGLCALSGTGSDIIYVENGKQKDLLGGWGAIIGDEGSGVWIGRQAIKAAVRATEGWESAEDTVLTCLIMEKYSLSRLREYIRGVLYASPAPFRKLGELAPLVSQAASMGDKVAINILRAAGKHMAEQQVAMMKRYGLEKEPTVYCGGAWKTGDIMRSAFESAVLERYPHMTFTLPMYELIVAGPAMLLMSKGLEGDALLEALAPKYTDLLYRKEQK